MVLLDACAVIAALHSSERKHDECRVLLENLTEPPYMTHLCVNEVCQHYRNRTLRPDIVAGFLSSIANGTIRIVEMTSEDFRRTAELVLQYASCKLDAADASIVAVAERLHITTVISIDERDFDIVEPKHVKRLARLP